MSKESVIVIGGGVAGLTAGSLLAHEGVPVTLLEAHHQPGGCAGTFSRGPYVFDAGATQVAGLERGGIHERLFRHLEIPLPEAALLDPVCLVDLLDGHDPIHLWHDSKRWEDERKRHFPGSEIFWWLCSALHKSNWAFAVRDPVLPIRNFWDFKQLFKALGPLNLSTSLLSKLTVADLLKMTACHKDERLWQFLEMQLRLYSQEPLDRTAALYGATVLQMAHEPLGLWHLEGSMQKLSDHLVEGFLRDSGLMQCRHRVVGLSLNNSSQQWEVDVIGPTGRSMQFQASDVVCSLPPQCLLDLLPPKKGCINQYRRKLEELPQPSGAIVFYGAINRSDIPKDCPSHLQLAFSGYGSLFVSLSRENDGRAPLSQATLIASVFTETSHWFHLDDFEYQQKKQVFLSTIVQRIENWLKLEPGNWLHKELATPRSFAKWTRRPMGIVGGLGQHPSVFGPFGLSSRTPIRGLWLCGDSIYPGEGTAGVSQSALMAFRQLMAERGKNIDISL